MKTDSFTHYRFRNLVALSMVIGILNGCESAAKPHNDLSKGLQTLPLDQNYDASSQLSMDMEDQLIAYEHSQDRKPLKSEAIAIVEHSQRDSTTESDSTSLDNLPPPPSLTIQFKFDQFELSKNAKNDLETLADFLVQNPNSTVSVSGHTDSTGPQEYNQILSKKRANAVANFLLSKGVIKAQLAVSAYGDTKPLLGSTLPQTNRRVEVSLNSDPSEPQFSASKLEAMESTPEEQLTMNAPNNSPDFISPAVESSLTTLISEEETDPDGLTLELEATKKVSAFTK